MDSEKLYRVQEEDLSKLEELLCRSFAADPLYAVSYTHLTLPTIYSV